MLKILFFHNTLPEYRIGWFEELSKQSYVKFIFTNEKINKKDYGNDIDYKRASNLNCIFFSDFFTGFMKLRSIMKNVSVFDFVELPPIDSLRELLYSIYIYYKCKKYSVKLGYFWEKWDAPFEKQPLIRKLKNFLLRLIPSNIYRNVDIVFAVGRKSKEYFISNKVNPNKIYLIPDVSETPVCKYVDLRKLYHIEKSKKIILYLGRLIPQKGVKELLKAYSLLDSNLRSKCFLLIAGDGVTFEKNKKFAESLQIENVVFVGKVAPSERQNYFSQCDIFVYPGIFFEGRVDVWGLSLNEALQHGKVLISTDAVGSAYELIKDGINGYRIEPGNIKELSNSLRKSVLNLNALKAKEKDLEIRNVYNFVNMAAEYIRGIESLDMSLKYR